MKYTIDYDDVGRDIDGPFNIIGSAEDLRDLAEQILTQIGSKDVPTFSYGTVFVRQRYLPRTNINRHLHWNQGARLPDSSIVANDLDKPRISGNFSFKQLQ